MTKEQKSEVRDYLLAKKLPIDLMMEVEDHFVSQINELQIENNLSFDDAFNAAIISWHDDLKLFWDGNWSLENTSVLIKKSTKQKLFSILKKTAVFGAIGYVLMILCYLFVSFEIFRICLIIMVGLLMIFPFIMYLKDKKYFDLPKKYKDIRLSTYQNLVTIFFILPMSSSWIFRFVIESNKGFLDVNHAEGIFVNFLLLFFFMFEAAIIISQQKYLEIIKKIIPYLQENFKTSN